MNRKFVYYIIFAISFLLFSIVQDYIRPNYDGANKIIIYLLGVAPNFLPGIGLPALLYVVIPEVLSHIVIILEMLDPILTKSPYDVVLPCEPSSIGRSIGYVYIHGICMYIYIHIYTHIYTYIHT